MVFRRKDRPSEGYRISPRLPKPWGRCGPWQTGLHRKAQAVAVETWVKEMALTNPAIIDLLVAGKFSLREAWIAKLRGTLDQLLVGINDPLLSDAVEAYRPECTDRRTRHGLTQILEYAEPNVRLSWLQGNNIRAMYRKALETRKPNSVRRSLHRAVCEVLTYHLKAKGKDSALDGVPIPGEDDTRVVSVTGDELQKMLDNCGPARWLAAAAITSAVDIGPLLRMTPRHINEAEGTVGVPDTKNKERPRLLRLSDVAMLAFRMAAMGKGLDERLWPMTSGRAYKWIKGAAITAGRPDLRPKDLRHVLPTLLAEGGMDRRMIQAYMGHAQGSKQTDRYITPTGDVPALNAAAEKLKLSHLMVS